MHFMNLWQEKTGQRPFREKNPDFLSRRSALIEKPPLIPSDGFAVSNSFLIIISYNASIPHKNSHAYLPILQ